MFLTLMLILSYLLGSIPFGKIICGYSGVDIQKRGSGNIGFANVLRIMGWRYALPTLIGDALKGYIPVMIAGQLSFSIPEQFLVGVAAIVGHVFSIFLKGKGGKGVATGLGVLLYFQPAAAICGLAVYTVLLRFKKESSAASILCLGIAALVGILLEHSFWWMYVVFMIMAAFTLRQNITGWLRSGDD